MRAIHLFLGLLVAASQGISQQNSQVQFEAASLKRLPPDSPAPFRCTGGIVSPDPIRFACSKTTLRQLVWIAHNTPYYQVVGPAWADTENYEINATMPPGTGKEVFMLMLQNLLKERFHLVVHTEPRETKMFALRVSDAGPKLTRSTNIPEAEKADDPVNMKVTGQQRGWRLDATRQSMKAFSRYLAIPTRTKVLDETGLSGPFDFSLDFNPRATLSADPNATDSSQESVPSIYIAIKSLGLKLDPIKAPLDILVIDSADKIPTEN